MRAFNLERRNLHHGADPCSAIDMVDAHDGRGRVVADSVRELRLIDQQHQHTHRNQDHIQNLQSPCHCDLNQPTLESSLIPKTMAIIL